MTFKAGDRVAFYTNGSRLILKISRVDFHNQWVFFEHQDNPSHANFMGHFKQCRKLVKKERRRVWVSEKALWQASTQTDFQAIFVTAKITRHPNDAYVEFIEVRKKK